ncbi:hypothetical protein KIH74_23265 [Kineosporia sp. J2-2]|uniref:ATP-binding protein n=1 Tax=Kineosporia corallincola TaxID=2835133 RepID=A0ABS5TNV2_9ACTN|nr:hypothetical protein [Kineosporia corallincola]MBT0771881.1 hypothetical protein [Kineosporia corallincola]
MGERFSLVGRGDSRNLISGLMQRPQARPVVVVEDPRGGGKSTLVSSLRETFVGHGIPFAILDMQEQDPATLREVIFAVAYQFSRDWGPPCGSIGLGRVLLAAQVVQAGLGGDLASREQDLRAIDLLVQKGRFGGEAVQRALSGAAGTLAESALKQFGIPGVLTGRLADLARQLPFWMMATLRAFPTGRRVVLGPSHAWFGEQGGGRRRRPSEVLLDLFRFCRPGEYEQHGQWVDELLLSALLADLTDHFAGHPARQYLKFGCALLIDDADHPVGRALVAALEQARERPGARPDPLTVVMTSRGGLLKGRSDVEILDFDTDPGAGQGGPPWTGRHRLLDLTQAHTGELMAQLDISGGRPRTTRRLVHEVTDGQPACTGWLVAVLDSTSRDRAGAPTDHRDFPRRLLDRPRAGNTTGAESRLGDWMLGYLLTGRPLGDVPPGRLDDLVTWCAAGNRSDAAALGFVADSTEQSLAVESLLWPARPTAMTRLLRRLLLERLAARDPDRPDGWESVFGALRRFGHGSEQQLDAELQAADEADPQHIADLRRMRLTRLGYGLAAGEVRPAAEYLARALPEIPPPQWLESLDLVAAAPHPPDRANRLASEEFAARLREFPERRPHLRQAVAALLLGGWITGDRLADAHRGSVYAEMVTSLQIVLSHSPHGDNQAFRRRIEVYGMESGFWL